MVKVNQSIIDTYYNMVKDSEILMPPWYKIDGTWHHILVDIDSGKLFYDGECIVEEKESDNWSWNNFVADYPSKTQYVVSVRLLKEKILEDISKSDEKTIEDSREYILVQEVKDIINKRSGI